MTTKIVLHKLAKAHGPLKTELRRTLARAYFQTDVVKAHRLDGLTKYQQSYKNLVQSYNKMKPTLIREELRPFVIQLGHIDLPRPLVGGRTKAFHEEEFKQDEEEENFRLTQVEEEEKAPTLDQL